MTYPRFKYVVCPGYVYSMNDRDRHFINAAKLVRLYGIDRHECIVLYLDRPCDLSLARWIEREHPEVLFLQPRYGGDYIVPNL